jgi:IclR family transcriptional regulator, KDG regulon repressor
MTQAAGGRSAAARILAILEAFSHERPDMTVRDFHERTGIPESTLFRLLRLLTQRGLVSHDSSTGRYAPGLKTIELGDIAARQLRIVEIVQPVLDDLQRATHLTANFSVWRGNSRVCVAKADSTLHLRDVVNVGDSYPIWLGAAGKAILAFLPDSLRLSIVSDAYADPPQRDSLIARLEQVREARLAVTEGERVPGMAAVSAPVFDRMGRVLGSVTVSGPAYQMRPAQDRHAEVVRVAARRLSEALG